jgi:hypothetical protein
MEPWHELQHSIIQIDFIQAGISEQTSMKTTINMENTQKHKNTKILHTTFMAISNQEEIPDTKEHGDFNQDWIPKTHKQNTKTFMLWLTTKTSWQSTGPVLNS